jgi:hypothetical protein
MSRALGATIRDFGDHPLVASLIAKADLFRLGSVKDRRNRIEMPRLDNEDTRSLIVQARRKIYFEGYVVNSQHVERLLKPTSLVPTIVRTFPLL